MGLNRYVVTIDFHLFNPNDETAKDWTEHIERFLESEYPGIISSVKTTSIVEQPFGTIGNREVYKP